MADIVKTSWWEQGLDALNEEQWEQLCDGCGLCCLHKLEDEDTGELHYTQLACDLLNTNTCECSDYAERFKRVPDCLKLTQQNYPQILPWLPNSCSYKRVANAQALPPWHHLLTGSKHMMHSNNLSVKGKVQNARGIDPDDYQDYVLRWVDYED